MTNPLQALRLTGKNTLFLDPHFIIPEPQEDELVIRVAYSGICGTDLHIIAGEFPSAPPPEDAHKGLIMGHEVSGYIHSIGPGVDATQFPLNAACTLNPNGQCAKCEPCRVGQPHFCVEMKHPGCGSVGVFRNGGWASHLVLPASYVYVLPSALSAKEAVLCEPYSCILRGYRQLNQAGVSTMQSDTRILLLGGGIIGVLWALLLRHRGHRLMTISEPSADRRKVVDGLGFVSVDPKSLPISSPLKGHFDIVIDCSGYPPAITAAIPLLACGGKILLFGCCPKGSKCTVDPFEIFDRELIIMGAKVNPYTFKECVQLVSDLSSELKFVDLGIEEFKLEDYDNAMLKLNNRSISKGIFRFP